MGNVWRLLGAAILACLCERRPAAQQSSPEPPYRLQVETQLVLVDASVERKRTGQPITGLAATDFVIAEDGVPQAISTVSEDVLPLSLVFLFDLTDTVHPVLQHLANGAPQMLRHLRPQDEVAVMTFSSHTRVEQRFTRDRMSAVEGVDAASASYERSEPTFVFEDLWEAVQTTETSRVIGARRVQVWVTDGAPTIRTCNAGWRTGRRQCCTTRPRQLQRCCNPESS